MRLVDFSRARAVRKESLARHLSRKAVRSIWRRPDLSELPAQRREMTFLVCRIRGFYELSAALAGEPETLIRISRLTMPFLAQEVSARGGTVDRLGPGELTAFFNAPVDDPQHATRACGAAIAMVHELEKVNRFLEQEKRRDGSALTPIDIGIGIDTGEAIAGVFGSGSFPAYSATGRAATLAHAIEKMSRHYGTAILAGGATRSLAEKNLAFLEVDHVAFDEGEPVRLYAVLGSRLSRGNASFLDLNAFHDRILQYYRAREWQRALALIAQARTLPGANPAVYDLYERRIAHWQRNPPASDWTGVLSLAEREFAAQKNGFRCG
jgi:adenylate cyclase